MSKTYLIRLEENDLGQILDGLKTREESWRKTADYLRSGYTADDSFIIESCSDEDEADCIVGFYSRVIADIERQREEQRR